MDFAEVEAMEGLRWPWNSWPPSPTAAADLVIPLSVLCTPLNPSPDLPVLPYDPLSCSKCAAVLNPFARVDYPSAVWSCPLCRARNPFPRSYAGIADHNLPAELFPTHSAVEYLLSRLSSIGSPRVFSGSDGAGAAAAAALGPAIVFVVDVCSPDSELRALKNEILLVVAQLPENALVGLVSLGSMVWVHDLGVADCSRVVVFDGERELGSEKIQELLGISRIRNRQVGLSPTFQKQGFLLPISECEFSITAAIEELTPSTAPSPGHRPHRATGAAISTSIAVLEGCSSSSGGRIMVFTSGPATTGPGKVVDTDISNSIRTHRDIVNGHSPWIEKSSSFYRGLARRLSDRSLVLDLFACSLDQVGASEMSSAIEVSGGVMFLAESFEAEQFRKCLRHLFKRDSTSYNMNFDATIDLVCSKEVKICGSLGPCLSLNKKNESVSEKEIGQGGTHSWKMSTLTSKTCLAFFFQLSGEQKPDSPSVFFIQFKTRYRQSGGGYRLRVTTTARRWVSARSPEIPSGFDQEAAAVVVARLAIARAKEFHARDVIRWLDKMLIQFASKFGQYVPEDPSTFRLSSNFSLYPQFMYYLRRSQFIDFFNNTPDETSFFRLMLNREGVLGSLLMIQPTLFQYSFEGPPIPVLLDVCSILPEVILLFDSYFHVVIHYGSEIARWRKLGYHRDPQHENFRKLLEAPEIDAAALVEERVPVPPRLVRCDQHGSQARFLLARLNPSVTQKTQLVDGSEVIFTDDISLQVFLEHLQALAVQG